MFIIKFLAKFLRILNSGGSPKQISGGFTLGLFMGIAPFWTLLNLFVGLLIIILDVNITACIAAFLLFRGIVYILDPLFHSLGFWLLADLEFLQGFWQRLLDLPLMAFSGLNNTTYLGSFLTGLIIALPCFFAVQWLVRRYRSHIAERIAKWKLVRWLNGLKIVGLFRKLSIPGRS